MDGKQQTWVLGGVSLNVFLDRFPIRRCWVPPSSGPPCLPDWCACGCAIVFCGFRPPSWGPIWAYASTWSTESFLVPLWPVTSGKSILSPNHPLRQACPSKWPKELGVVGSRGKNFLLKGRAKVWMSPALHVVVFLNFPWCFSKKRRRKRLSISRAQLLPHLKPQLKWLAVLLSDSDLMPYLEGI